MFYNKSTLWRATSSSSSGITFVGSAIGNGYNTTSIDMPAGCQIGDTVFLAALCYRDGDTAADITISTSGYTLMLSSFYGGYLRTYTKTFTSSVDSTVSVSTVGSTMVICALQVWRGVNSTTPMDVTPQRTVGSVYPNSITPITPGSLVMAISGGGTGSSSPPANPTGYSNLLSHIALVGTTYGRVCIYSKNWSGSGSESPPQWGAAELNPTGAHTLAIRPS